MIIETEADLLAGIAALCDLDGRLTPICDRIGTPPLRRRPRGLEGLAWIITGQQISLTSAEAIWRRTCATVGRFDPERILDVSDDAWRAAGQSRAKTAALRAVAEAMRAGDLDLDHLARLNDAGAEAILVSLKGVGPWTASMYLLACEGRPDVLPGADIALQAAAADALGLASRPSAAALTTLAEQWRPWRAVAARVLWAHYAIMRAI